MQQHAILDARSGYLSALAPFFVPEGSGWPIPALEQAEDAEDLRDTSCPDAVPKACARVKVGLHAGGHDDFRTLLGRIHRRDESALNALHAACADRLLACALRILRRPEMAAEAVSATFLQAWNHAGDFDERRANVMSWLTMILRSRALDMLRQTRVRCQHECALTETELESTPGVGLSPYGRIEQSQQRVGLRRAMATLTPMQRQVLSLLFLEGHSHEEAAARIGVPLGTLKSHSRRALAALRAHSGLRAMCA